MRFKLVFIVVAILLTCLAHIRFFECATVDCPNKVYQDGDLCESCQFWLEGSEPITFEMLLNPGPHA